MFAVTILGNNSALPAYDRHPTAQVVTMDQFDFLVDCGEGTQMQLARYRMKRSRISHIFISHLHGDHYFGLIGLLTSMGLLGREAPIHLYAPVELEAIIQLQLKIADTSLPYALHFHALPVGGGVIEEQQKFSVSCFPTYHRIPCWGFIFRQKIKPRKLIKEALLQYEIPAAFYDRLKEGEDYTNKSGEVIKNDVVTVANKPGLSYAFCGDTVYTESIADDVKDVSMLYHETTYLKDLTERAASRFHSTTEQAATIAVKANVNKLLIGHFSSKYEKLDAFLAEARAVFPNTDLAIEGVTYTV